MVLILALDHDIGHNFVNEVDLDMIGLKGTIHRNYVSFMQMNVSIKQALH